MNSAAEICPECGAAMTRDTRPLSLTYKGVTETVQMPGLYCTDCAESVHTGADMAVADRALHRAKARAENLLQPEEVRSVRRRLRLTQEAAGRLIGGGPSAFHKYEKGEVLPSQAASNLLRVLDAFPSGLEILMHSEARDGIAKAGGKHRKTAETP